MKCIHDPREYADEPMGMYHCPVCGNLVIAGLDHGPVECNDCMELIEECKCKSKESQ